MALTREQILAADDIKRQAVKVPEWGGDVFVKVMTGEERDAFELDTLAEGRDRRNIRAKLLARCLCDDNGKRLFTDAEIAALAAKSGGALNRLFDVAIKLNRIGNDEIEELEKN